MLTLTAQVTRDTVTGGITTLQFGGNPSLPQVTRTILAGTELPLLMRDPTIADLPALDTTGLHVAAIIERRRA
jgi:hypothetical protein